MPAINARAEDLILNYATELGSNLLPTRESTHLRGVQGLQEQTDSAPESRQFSVVGQSPHVAGSAADRPLKAEIVTQISTSREMVEFQNILKSLAPCESIFAELPRSPSQWGPG